MKNAMQFTERRKTNVEQPVQVPYVSREVTSTANELTSTNK